MKIPIQAVHFPEADFTKFMTPEVIELVENCHGKAAAKPKRPFAATVLFGLPSNRNRFIRLCRDSGLNPIPDVSGEYIDAEKLSDNAMEPCGV